MSTKDRSWFERKVCELGDVLRRLPRPRQRALVDALDTGQDPDARHGRERSLDAEGGESGSRPTMRAFHRTSHAPDILRDGFKDAEGTYLTDRVWRGVWVSDRPLDINEGATATCCLLSMFPPNSSPSTNGWKRASLTARA